MAIERCSLISAVVAAALLAGGVSSQTTTEAVVPDDAGPGNAAKLYAMAFVVGRSCTSVSTAMA